MKNTKLVSAGSNPDACCGPARSSAELPLSSAAVAKDAIREAVKQRYGQAVRSFVESEQASCCGSDWAATGMGGTDPITRNLYESEQAGAVPEDALLASFGCGNPTALADLRPGETVLDLGSGGGIDVLLSAHRVGPTGKAYGLDMTDEMLELALQNKSKSGVSNVEFLKGHIEAIPLPAASVDVIISNCVINLSSDKDKVLAEAFRVLRSGGRFAVSDIVIRRELPPDVRKSMELWTGCVAGALLESDYVAKLRAAGFNHIQIEPTRIYSKDDTAEMASSCCGVEVEAALEALDGAVMSAFVRAQKP